MEVLINLILFKRMADSNKKKSQIISLEEQSENKGKDGMIEVEDNSVDIVCVEVPISDNQQKKEEPKNDIKPKQKKPRTSSLLHSFKISANSGPNIKNYLRLISEMVQNLILDIPEYLKDLPQQIKQLKALDKDGITVMAILNMGILKKLNFINEKLQRQNPVKEQSKIIKQQIEYWKQYLFQSLIETSQQQARYGNICIKIR